MNHTALPEHDGRLVLRDLYLHKKAHTADPGESQPAADLQPLMAGIAVWMGVIGLLWLIG